MEYKSKSFKNLKLHKRTKNNRYATCIITKNGENGSYYLKFFTNESNYNGNLLIQLFYNKKEFLYMWLHTCFIDTNQNKLSFNKSEIDILYFDHSNKKAPSNVSFDILLG